MGGFAEFYSGMIVVTGLFLFFDVRPRGAGEWFSLAGISLLWPAAFGYVLYSVIRHGSA